jgi:hypothetical protein
MKNDKRTAEDSNTLKGCKSAKMPYEKPILATVLLFADQVLSICGKVNPAVPSCDALKGGSPANS